MSASLLVLVTSITFMLGLLALAWWLLRLPVELSEISQVTQQASPSVRQRMDPRPVVTPAPASPPEQATAILAPPDPVTEPEFDESEATTMYLRVPDGIVESSGTQILLDPSSPVAPRRVGPPPPPPAKGRR